jgi:sulfite reductase alpha subunit-like flavoprotein
MSLDVEKALVELAQYHGNKSEQESREWLGQLKESGRYLVDVY